MDYFYHLNNNKLTPKSLFLENLLTSYKYIELFNKKILINSSLYLFLFGTINNILPVNFSSFH